LLCLALRSLFNAVFIVGLKKLLATTKILSFIMAPTRSEEVKKHIEKGQGVTSPKFSLQPTGKNPAHALDG
jgi:hypothetical protein